MKTTCGFYIINNKLELLICHPTKHPDNIWSIPKGMKDKDEDEFDAAKRELLEETNINYNDLESNIKLVNIFPKFSHTKWQKGKKELYSALLICDTDFSEFELKCESYVNDDKTFPEIDEYKWVNLLEAKDHLHYTQLVHLEQIKIIVNGLYS